MKIATVWYLKNRFEFKVLHNDDVMKNKKLYNKEKIIFQN